MAFMVLAVIWSSIVWVGWILIGAITGALAGQVMRGKGFGMLVDIVVGILGALLGGWWFLGQMIPTDSGTIWSFVVAFLWAGLLIFLVRLFRGHRNVFSR